MNHKYLKPSTEYAYTQSNLGMYNFWANANEPDRGATVIKGRIFDASHLQFYLAKKKLIHTSQKIYAENRKLWKFQNCPQVTCSDCHVYIRKENKIEKATRAKMQILSRATFDVLIPRHTLWIVSYERQWESISALVFQIGIGRVALWWYRLGAAPISRHQTLGRLSFNSARERKGEREWDTLFGFQGGVASLFALLLH